MSKNIFRPKFNNTRSYVIDGELSDRETWQEARTRLSSRDVVTGAHSFHSKAEALRYIELRELFIEGRIEGLRLQPRYDLVVGGMKVCTYIADFEYFETEIDKLVTEDVKGKKTPEYKLKSRLFHITWCRAQHRVFRETKKNRKQGFKVDTFPPPE